MNEDPAYLRAVSLHLSRTLDEIGFNVLTAKRRRQTHLFREQLTNVFCRLSGINSYIYHFGSQTEGATTPGLNSDIDTLTCYNNFNVIQDWVGWKLGKTNLLLLQDNTATGYCRLQMLRSDIPMAREDLPSEHCTYDGNGRVILKNTVFHTPVSGLQNVRNGPARSESGHPYVFDVDYVNALKCRSWPRQAEEFIRRRRRYGWPSPCLLQQAIKHGFFLVPVGYKLSPTEHLEWRVSASLAERCLMFSLNIVHIKCYVVLKMLMKTFVVPLEGKCLSSYHCKTAVFYCTENTEPDFWRDDNLLPCVIQCLLLLRTWVTDRVCPHFIISKENLFAGKVTAENRGTLLSILTDLIRSKGRVLQRVLTDDLGKKLQIKLNSKPSFKPVLDSLATVKLIGELEYQRHKHIADCSGEILLEYKITKPISAIHSVYQKIEILKDRLALSDKHERQALQALITFLFCWLGSLLASVSLRYKMGIPREAIQLLYVGAKFDVAFMLKLASIFYCKGDLQKAETILQKLEIYFHRNEIRRVCACYSKPGKTSMAFSQIMFALRGKKARAKRFAYCVRFTSQEIHCTPPAFQNELFKSVGDDIKNRDPKQDKWMVLAAVDCLPCLYYLQYITYRQLGKHELRRQALHNLDLCIRQDNDFRHLETAWNLLGQCFELEQETESAMACYSTSLGIRRRNNAANWHVAILCYRFIRSASIHPC